jgi:RNA polymerase sigma-70 factor (ECF subfamily)
MNLANAAVAAPNPAATAVSWSEMVLHREPLVRFARRKLLDPTLAEDVVHDVFEAVISGRASFEGRSAMRSWLTGILKHKIVDLVRQRAPFESLDDETEDAGTLALECPQPRPDQQAEQRQLLSRVLSRIETLPAGLRDVMHLRVLQERTTQEVCATLAISEENLFVRLHRARKHLLS